MTDKEKLEKVIKGLECYTQHGSMSGRNCNGHWGYTDASHTHMELIGEYRAGCTYGRCETGCVKTLAKDALALLKALTAFKRYFDGLYGQGLEVANWHMNGATEPFDGFYDSAMEEYENERKAVRSVRVGL